MTSGDVDKGDRVELGMNFSFHSKEVWFGGIVRAGCDEPFEPLTKQSKMKQD